MIVDAHHHFWDPARAAYPWLTDELAPIRRAFGPADLAPVLAAAGVEATVLVQTRSSLAETEEFLATAAATPFVRGVVGWVDLRDPAVDDVIARLKDGPGGDRLVGIRHQVHDEDDADWLLRDDVRRGIEAVGRAGLAYDLLIRSREMPAARAVVAAYPDVRFVVDHLAKPAIVDATRQPWVGLVTDLGGLPNTWWKLSGLVTEADWSRWTPADLGPYVEHVLAVVGPERLMFGSDWPVCLLAATYDEVLAAARETLDGLSGTEQAAVLGTNAIVVYGLAAG
ncbi:MAG TPA: amidohydrolase family protein [Candidatus Limnocylindrales bacterium]|nr:amidohydrolase family protein [Candidatus Limnocylindrales bacterium]